MERNKKHVVIGAGASGLALAKRLLEKSDVILVDRGDIDVETPKSSATKQDASYNIYPLIDLWGFQAFLSNQSILKGTEGQKGMMGRVINYAQGFGKGGSGGINAMIYSLGNSVVYDKLWPNDWKSTRIQSLLHNLLYYYTPRRMLTSGQVRPILKGPESRFEIGASIMDNKGYVPEYFASIAPNGMRRLNQTQLSLSYPCNKITTMPHCTVKKILFEDTKAVSVVLTQYHSNDTTSELIISPENGGEIILCAGTFESPRILIASGLKRNSSTTSSTATGSTMSTTNTSTPSSCIKESNHDSQRQAEVVLPNLHSIGENLQDHVIVPYMFICNWYENWRLEYSSNIPGYGEQPAYPLNGIHGWVNLAEDGTIWSDQNCTSPPSIQLLFIDGQVSATILPTMIPRFPDAEGGVYMRFFYPLLVGIFKYITSFTFIRWLCGHFFGVLICLTQPHSRGRLREDSQNPQKPLLIDPQYLTDNRDLDTLYAGMRTARAIIEQSSVKNGGGLRYTEVLPGPLFRYSSTRAWFDFFARLMSTTYFHACGTCRMIPTLPNTKDSRSDIEGDDGTTIVATSTVSAKGGEVPKDSSIEGVVDSEFRVLGVSGLRVVDASVIPAIPSSPTHALCMVLGEACGQLLNSD